MKKTYITPSMKTIALKNMVLLAGSTGDINNVNVSSTETISDSNDFGARESDFFDDEEW